MTIQMMNTQQMCSREREREEVGSIDRRRVRKRRRWVGRVMRYEWGHKTLCTYSDNQEKDTRAHAVN